MDKLILLLLADDDIIKTEVPLDIDGNSGFTLDWKVGDAVVFKEFSSIEDTPTTPLQTWVAKGVIEDWTDNTFQDDATSLLSNGSFNFEYDLLLRNHIIHLFFYILS